MKSTMKKGQMRRVITYLSQKSEPMPEWLLEHTAGDPIDIKKVFQSRVAYYPWGGDDGSFIRSLNKAHYAHVYIYTNANMSEERYRKLISDKGAFRGYHLLDTQNVSEQELTPKGWTPHVFPRESPVRFSRRIEPYCLLSVFERDETYGEDHGEKRFVLIQLFADADATYDALFGNKNVNVDVMVVTSAAQRNKENLMEEIAKKTETYPEYIYFDRIATPWGGYEQVPGLEPETGRWWGDPRILYRHKNRR